MAFDLARILAIGTIVGAAGGWLARLAMRLTGATGAGVLLSVAAAYTSYLAPSG